MHFSLLLYPLEFLASRVESWSLWAVPEDSVPEQRCGVFLEISLEYSTSNINMPSMPCSEWGVSTVPLDAVHKTSAHMKKVNQLLISGE